ncbi:M48 family metallopeptidase [Pseudidiomarina terrestris]|nr:SprT family zinc-dependent metalloprotease [Pseudidiomarina sp. 1APP75-32.1]
MTLEGFEVVAPESAQLEDVERALSQKKKWIIENHEDLRQKYFETHKIARFTTGAKLPYWGRLVRLNTRLSSANSPVVCYQGGIAVEHPVYSSLDERETAIEAAIQRYLKVRVTQELKPFVKRYSDVLGVTPRAANVREMKARWGSCSKSAKISVDWRLVYGPKRVLGYVVAHELAHLVIDDHSPAFWRLLKKAYGPFEREHAWLMKNEHLLGYNKLVIGEEKTNFASSNLVFSGSE